ncbi:MAG: hypothetical protein ABWZ80_02535 [Beijerinckiaceae bacterium]
MTTAAQVKAVVKPLLERNPDLALVGRLVVLKPVRHLLRGIYLDWSSAKELFTPAFAVTPLCEPDKHFHFTYGRRLARGYWNVHDPATSQEMCKAIESEALPLLRPVETLDQFVEYVANPEIWGPSDDHPLTSAIIHAAHGDFEASLRACDKVVRSNHYISFMPQEYGSVIHLLRPLIVAGDRRGLSRLFHRWEGIAVRVNKVEHLWQETAFPFEIASDHAYAQRQ